MLGFSKIQFLVMVTLVRSPMHPYLIRQEIIELTSRQVWPVRSSVRRALDSLVRAGYIQEVSYSDPHYWIKTRRGAPYEITEAGYWKVRRELSMYHEVFTKSWQQLDTLGDRLDGSVH
jgi:DNA-binding PadR family transcriptional regulator